MAIDRDGDGPPLRREDAATPRPADDLRATPFTDNVFDEEYYGRKRRSGPSFGLIIGVIFGAGVAATAGWYVFGTREMSSAGGEGGSQVVKADPNPYKAKPDSPGGMQVDNQDKLVYDRLNRAAPPNRVENLLPEPEQPKAPPAKKAEPVPEPPAQATASGAEDPLAKLVAEVAGQKEPPPAAPKPAEKAMTPASPTVAAEKPMTPAAPAAAPAPVAVASAEAPAEKPMTPASPPPPAAAPMALAPVIAVPAPAPTAPTVAPQVAAVQAPPAAPAQTATAPTMAAPAAVGAAGVYLQLASARSEDAALSEWKRINGKNGDVLAGLSPVVSQAEVPDKGTFFRLRAGPVADKPTAEGLCATLSSRNVGCIVVRQ